jgi:hypothetical protein
VRSLRAPGQTFILQQKGDFLSVWFQTDWEGRSIVSQIDQSDSWGGCVFKTTMTMVTLLGAYHQKGPRNPYLYLTPYRHGLISTVTSVIVNMAMYP